LNNTLSCWKSPKAVYAVLGLIIVVLSVAFSDTISNMFHRLGTRKEYGYAYLIPFITAFFIWQRKNELVQTKFESSWYGLLTIALGGVIFFVGAVSTTHTISQYAMIMIILGVALSLMGWEAFKIVVIPLGLLLFMVPLPPFIYNTLSTKLQLISSELGVAVIRLFGISVYLEGNVIDLGSYKLQVVEACSGLRYLFPLVVLSFIAAYIYRAEFWKKVIVVLSSIPITIFMNSFRIGVIGVLVENYGSEQAEGFLHYFEGWVIFMSSMAILILEMMVLSRIGKNKRSLSDAFLLELPDKLSCGETRIRRLSAHYYVVLLLSGSILAASMFSQGRVEQDISRKLFADFPLNIAGWKGDNSKLEQIYLDGLKLDDYILADYVDSNRQAMNLYIAYYSDQQAGEAAHSPKACIPGGGWLIKQHSVVMLGELSTKPGGVEVNRLLIKKGDYTQLVYYWFQQRGRFITNEYLVKWYLFQDALARGRTDGALVRLTALVGPGQDVEDAELRLQDFAKEVIPMLDEYIPE